MIKITELINEDTKAILRIGTKWTDGFDIFTIRTMKFDKEDFMVNCEEDQEFTWRYAKHFGKKYKYLNK